jgi:hypothetical protein
MFVSCPRPDGEHGRGGYWTLNLTNADLYTNVKKQGPKTSVSKASSEPDGVALNNPEPDTDSIEPRKLIDDDCSALKNVHRDPSFSTDELSIHACYLFKFMACYIYLFC